VGRYYVGCSCKIYIFPLLRIIAFGISSVFFLRFAISALLQSFFLGPDHTTKYTITSFLITSSSEEQAKKGPSGQSGNGIWNGVMNQPDPLVWYESVSPFRHICWGSKKLSNPEATCDSKITVYKVVSRYCLKLPDART